LKVGKPVIGIFPIDGRSMSLNSFHVGIRATCNTSCDATEMTSYSWRRFASTLADARRLDHAARLCLGSWQGKLDMPYHYTGDKLSAEKVEKIAQVTRLKDVWHSLTDWPRLRLLLSADRVAREEACIAEATRMMAENDITEEIPIGWRPEGLTAARTISLKRPRMRPRPVEVVQKKQKTHHIPVPKVEARRWVSSSKGRIHLTLGEAPLCGISFSSATTFQRGDDVTVPFTEGKLVCDRCFAKADDNTKAAILRD
jgi:hypothetical protein